MNESLELIFDKLKEQDLEEVAQIYDAERPMNTNRTKMKQTFNQIKDNSDYKMIVAKFNNEIVGFAKVIIHHDIFEDCKDYATIWSVRRKYKRQGVGTKMFRVIEEDLKSIELYVKPEENRAYFVINGDITGNFHI